MQQLQNNVEVEVEKLKALDTESTVAILGSNSSNNEGMSGIEVNCGNVKTSTKTSNSERAYDDDKMEKIQFNNNSSAYNQAMKMKNNVGGMTESFSTRSSDLHSQFMKWLEEKKKHPNREEVENVNWSDEKVIREIITSKEEVESSNFCGAQSSVIGSEDDKTNESKSNNNKTESVVANADDFDEFKDVIDDEEVKETTEESAMVMEEKQQEVNVMNVPLVIAVNKYDHATTNEDGKSSFADSNSNTLLPLTITEKENDEKSNVIEAKFTLTSSLPLEIVTKKSLSTSCTSLESSKLPPRHNKGQAPPPPGQFYDKDKNKYFKETEL